MDLVMVTGILFALIVAPILWRSRHKNKRRLVEKVVLVVFLAWLIFALRACLWEKEPHASLHWVRKHPVSSTPFASLPISPTLLLPTRCLAKLIVILIISLQFDPLSPDTALFFQWPERQMWNETKNCWKTSPGLAAGRKQEYSARSNRKFWS